MLIKSECQTDQTRSTVLTSQLPVSRWHEQIGDPTIADGILDRLVHNAHRIEMRGDSMRKKRNPPAEDKEEQKKQKPSLYHREKQGRKGLPPLSPAPNPRPKPLRCAPEKPRSPL